MTTVGLSVKVMKSSAVSDPVPPSLQLMASRTGAIILQEPEQLPGSIIGTTIAQVGLLASVIVIITLPPPAEPACN